MNILCKLFNHKVSQIALLICEIKSNNLNDGKPNIMKCERCNWTLDLNNKKAIGTYIQLPNSFLQIMKLSKTFLKKMAS